MSYPQPLKISGPLMNQPYPPLYNSEKSNPQNRGYDREFPYETYINRNEKGPIEQTSSLAMQQMAMPQMANTVTIPAELFEKMYNGSHSVSVEPRKPFGNPTPISIVGFLLSLSPLSCDLMGWRGAGGNGAASIGAYFFIGGVLMLLGGFMEWVMGNTFPFVVFASFGGFWFAYGATLLPFFNAFGAYSPDPSSPGDGLATRGFNASFGFFMAFMAVLCLVFLICSLRTNMVFVIIFASLFGGFILLTATFWLIADTNSALAGKMLFMAGLITFVGDMAGWYLLLALLLLSIDFPIQLPLGDLSGWITGFSEKTKSRENMA